MRHLKKKITLGRVKGPRKALLRSLVESFILHGSIRTTRAKARALRTKVEPLITRAKRGTLADRRHAISFLYTDKAVKKLFDEIAPKYKDRKGGYTRIIKLTSRVNDGAEMARIELV